MNGNTVGATTLAYLRGEKDLFRERERIVQLRKQVQNTGLALGLSEPQKRKIERFWKIASLLQENSRMTLTDISKEIKIPISTIFDTLEELRKVFLFTIVLKEGEKQASIGTPSTLEFGYQVSIDASEEKGRQCTLDSE